MNTKRISDQSGLLAIKELYNQQLAACRNTILVCGGAGCVSSGCAETVAEVHKVLEEIGLSGAVKVLETGCMGTCSSGPVMLIQPEGIFYTNVTPKRVRRVLPRYLLQNEIFIRYTFYDHTLGKYVPNINDISFFKQQVKIALRNCGAMEHASMDAFIARDGYQAAAKVLSMDSTDVVEELKRSGLMGRGGAGFPTGLKWEAGLQASGQRKYLVCNADEGDPGAFMDRSLIEGDPHSLIEGMLIGAHAIGASQGYIYIRAEYPLAVERLSHALEQAREHGLLGENILSSGFCFDLEIRIGAGAFVCGEETALMNSIEGKRGEPRQRPPYPVQKGLFGMPTVIDNVETFANVPPIFLKGADWYTGYGTAASKGTKVFALAGDIANTGIVEVPMGTPLGNILYDIGGGVPGKKAFKAAQIGGPSGGCITSKHLNIPVDFDSLKEVYAIMGSGGLVVMNEDTCMVDASRYFMEFVQEESCGKCVACRIGTKRMLEILERICEGSGEEGDIELLEELGHTIRKTAMCGLGQNAPNPVLSAIYNFREEFEEHIRHQRCSASVCSSMFHSPCENTCPAGINVPGYMSLVAEGRFLDAYNLIRQESPFPAVCGRICTRPCENKCRRASVDESIAICDLKRFVADYAYRHEVAYSQDPAFPKNGKSVSIVGAGAAGLTCAYYLARIGYDVDVFEAEGVAGGVLAYGIPEYRLPMDVLQHEIDLILREGITLHLETNIGQDLPFEALQARSQAVFIATGAHIPLQVDIPGEDLDGVLHGIDFLKQIGLEQETGIGKKVVVIGGGNTAIDSARSALRLGADSVTILYRRTQAMMPAYESEVSEAVEEGVQIVELAQPLRFIGERGRVTGVECQRMSLGDFDLDGLRVSVPLEGDTFLLEADTVIPAISQNADLPFIPANRIGVTPWGTFAIDPNTMMTDVEGVFAGGDFARGPDTVIQAIADGKKAAISIDRHLGGRGILNKGSEIKVSPRYDDDIEELPRYPLDMLDMDQRRDSFDEVVLGYHKLTAMAEAMRCLHCERRS